MKIQTNPFHRGTTWILLSLLVLGVVAEPAKPKPPPPEPVAAGVVIGVTVVACGGVCVYMLIRTCKRIFDNTNQPSNWTDGTCSERTVAPTNWTDSNPAAIWYLQKSDDGGKTWFEIDVQVGRVNDLDFFDNYPNDSECAIYRLLGE
jgi:hypothetical protein